MRTTNFIAALSLVVSLAACGKGDKKAEPTKAETPSAAPSSTTTAPPAAKPAETAPAAAKAIDLGKAGAAWAGFHVNASSGGEVTDNGAGGAVINFSDNTMVQLTPAEADQSAFKQALSANYKKVTFQVDKPDDLSFTTVSDMGGTPITGYGFSVVVTAGGKKVACGSSYDDQATADRIKAVCKSLAKS